MPVTKEDVLDAIEELNENRLDLLTEYWLSLIEEGEKTPDNVTLHTLTCANMLYAGKAYQDTLDWLDATGGEIAKTYGEEGDVHVAFVENEDIENLRMNALDKSTIEEEEDDDFGAEDE